MKKVTVTYTLEEEELAHIGKALADKIAVNRKEAQNTFTSSKSVEHKRGELSWYLGNTEWQISLFHKLGFENDFSATLDTIRLLLNNLDRS